LHLTLSTVPHAFSGPFSDGDTSDEWLLDAPDVVIISKDKNEPIPEINVREWAGYGGF
jgi:hypothetical protein